MSEKKRINLFSFGRRWGMYPGPPVKNELQFVVDIRAAIKDPYDDHPGIDGTDDRIKAFLEAQPNFFNWFNHVIKRQLVNQIADLERKDGVKALNVYYMCEGGFQRSVALVDLVYDYLTQSLGLNLEITKQHLSMELLRATFITEKSKK